MIKSRLGALSLRLGSRAKRAARVRLGRPAAGTPAFSDSLWGLDIIFHQATLSLTRGESRVRNAAKVPDPSMMVGGEVGDQIRGGRSPLRAGSIEMNYFQLDEMSK